MLNKKVINLLVVNIVFVVSFLFFTTNVSAANEWYYCADAETGIAQTGCFAEYNSTYAIERCKGKGNVAGSYATKEECYEDAKGSVSTGLKNILEGDPTACMCKSKENPKGMCVPAEQGEGKNPDGSATVVNVCRSDYFDDLKKQGFDCILVQGTMEYCEKLVNAPDSGPEVKPNPCEIGDGFIIQGDCRDISVFVYMLINVGKYLFAIVGSLVLLMMVLGGLQLIISQGNPEKIKKAKDIMVGAVIGLLIVFGAYTLVDFLGDSLGIQKALDINTDTSINQEEPAGKK